jgi:Ni/Co efflux regulator RcnB
MSLKTGGVAMNMDIKKSFIVVLSVLTVLTVLAGCARKSQDDTAAPQKQEKSEKADKKADKKAEKKVDKKAEKKDEKKDESKTGVIGTPASGSKFSKVKLGMTMNEVFAKIGRPDSQWERPTGKSHIPFYFGDDRWVIECSYKKEGRLTFNGGGAHELNTIEVNRKESTE